MVVVLSGSMEPSMYRGDILVLMKRPTLDVGDTVVYQIEGEKIPIVHRITTLQDVKQEDGTTKSIFLTKGDNNPIDDRGLYPKRMNYITEDNVVGHVYA